MISSKYDGLSDREIIALINAAAESIKYAMAMTGSYAFDSFSCVDAAVKSLNDLHAILDKRKLYGQVA